MNKKSVLLGFLLIPAILISQGQRIILPPVFDAAKEAPLEERIAKAKKAFTRPVKDYIKDLKFGTSSQRNDAALALGELKDTSVMPEIFDMLGDSDANVRASAAECLGYIGDRAAAPKLESATKDESKLVRYSAIKALGSIKDERGVWALISALDENDRTIRKAAAQGLGNIGSKAATVKLINSLSDASSDVRITAAESLGVIGDTIAVPGLKNTLLNDPDRNVKFRASRSLARLGDNGGLDMLFKGLKDSQPEIREMSIRSLVYLSDDAVVERLQWVSDNDETKELRELAKSAVGAIKARAKK